MNRGIPLRSDFDGAELRRLSKASKNAKQARRLLALAAVYDGESRSRAAQIGGMDRQTLRDWVHRFDAEGPQGLIDRKPPGPARRLSDTQMMELSAIVEAGPDRDRDGVVRWRRVDLKRVIQERLGITYAERSVGELLKALGFSHVSARPQALGQDPHQVEAFKKNFRDRITDLTRLLPADTAIEVWFQDEARIGQKNGLVYQWARRGSRPRQPQDQRYENAYLFGAICAERGTGAALTLPCCDTQAMNLHLQEIAQAVAPGAHALVVLDRAPWHRASTLQVPKNITLALLPPRSPELNPVENVWQFLRQTWLSNRVFDTYEDVVDACCNAWNNLIQQPQRITTIATRTWATTGQN